jgi:long-chain acyl-CoA synthetase
MLITIGYIGGENIFPAEIEERLLRHPTINEACVVGMPDNRYGEVVSCFVRLKSSAERVTASEVSDWVKRAMGSHKAPKYVWWVGRDGVCQDFPKTGSGKYQKHILKEIGKALIKSGPVTAKL